MSYADFLARKALVSTPTGIADVPSLSARLKEHETLLTRWALRRGRAAVFADTGLGKGWIAMEWARVVTEYVRMPVLILAPLAVSQQFDHESHKLGDAITVAASHADVGSDGVYVTNYHKLHKFDPDAFGGVVIDESSILKSLDGKTRRLLIDSFRETPFRLSVTATPSPNDFTELGGQSEFLGVMTHAEMLATFFVHDGGSTKDWRLKGHARDAFWKWVTSWGAIVKYPSDIGASDDCYVLPPLIYHEYIVPANQDDLLASGMLFAKPAEGLSEQRDARRDTITSRCALSAKIANEASGQVIVWCDLNAESEYLRDAISGSVEVTGSQDDDEKERRIADFVSGKARVLVSKPSICGFGLNLQFVRTVIFCGVTHCYDESTEVLTGRGWLTFDRVSLDDEIATINQASLAFEWQHPSEVIWKPYCGEMLHFKGQRNFDLLVTPNHNLFVQRCPIRFASGGAWLLTEAATLANRFRRQEYRMRSAAAEWRGSNPETISLPIPGNFRLGGRARLLREIPIETYVRLAGWFITEGHCRPLDSEHGGQTVICQTSKHPDYREEIIALLQSLGLPVNHKTKDITVHSKQLAANLIENFGHLSAYKRIPKWMKDLDRHLLVILRDTILKGDGCHTDGVPRFLRTTSQQLADDFQEICIKTGVRASVHRRTVTGNAGKSIAYDVCVAWENTRPAIHNVPQRVAYEGMIGCVTVPNHTVIVRRNGIAVVSGNSFESFYQAVRRCWRFGVEGEVHVHVVSSELEGNVVASLREKQRKADELSAETRHYVAAYVRESVTSAQRDTIAYTPSREIEWPEWLQTELA